MNQRNPFLLKTQYYDKMNTQVREINTDAVPNTDTKYVNNSDKSVKLREAQLLTELAFERKRFAEVELVLLNQKVNSAQVLIQNFELKIQQLKRDMSLYATTIENKKKEVESLLREYENRKNLVDDSG